jgi:hypothetical protein
VLAAFWEGGFSMREFLRLRTRFFLSVAVAASILFPLIAAGADDTQLTKDQIKEFLLTAQVVKSKEAKKGITDTQRLTLSNGTITHDASFQSVDEHKDEMEFANGTKELRFVDSYKYNIAAYRLAELLGIDDMLPVYVERKWNGRVGSLSWWLPVKMDDSERMRKKIDPPDLDSWNNQMYRIRVFDQLVYDTDPNLTNILIGEDWTIWRIDFSRAFRTFKELKSPKDLVKCDRQLLEKLKALKADELSEKTKGYLTKDEVKGVMARRDKIVAHFQAEIAAKGESDVLY